MGSVSKLKFCLKITELFTKCLPKLLPNEVSRHAKVGAGKSRASAAREMMSSTAPVFSSGGPTLEEENTWPCVTVCPSKYLLENFYDENFYHKGTC